MKYGNRNPVVADVAELRIGANVLPYGPLSPRKPISSASPFVGRPFPCASYCGLACGFLNSLKEPKVLIRGHQMKMRNV